MIKFVQGETVVIDVTVVERDGSASILAGMTAIFAYQTAADTVIKKAGTIADNIITIELTAAETEDLLGKYPFELKIEDVNQKVDTVVKDTFVVSASLMPVYGLN